MTRFTEYYADGGINVTELTQELWLVRKALKDPDGFVDGKPINLRLFKSPPYSFDLGRTYHTESGWLAERYLAWNPKYKANPVAPVITSEMEERLQTLKDKGHWPKFDLDGNIFYLADDKEHSIARMA